jgi:CHAT domain-containing protein/tetratricopeptide (TPR) repeat protein
MSVVFARILLIAAGIGAFAGWSLPTLAQSREELFERAKTSCISEFGSLPRSPDKREKIGECIRTKMKGTMRGISRATVSGINDLIEDGRLAEAEAAARASIARHSETLGPNTGPVGADYMILAKTYNRMARFKEAENAARYAFTILESTAGPGAPATNGSRINLGSALTSLARFREADAYLTRAIEAAGSNPQQSAMALYNLARLRTDEGRLADAEKLALRSQALVEKSYGPKSEEAVQLLHRLAFIAMVGGRYAESEGHFQRALAVGEAELRPQHWLLGMLLRDLGSLYANTGRLKEAEAVLQRAIANLNKSIGPQYRHTLVAVGRLADVYLKGGRAQEAEPILRQALAASEKTVGPNHGDNVKLLQSLGLALQRQERYAEAEPMFKRAIAIAESLTQGEGRDAGAAWGYLGSLYIDQHRNAEAKEALETGQSKSLAVLGQEHPTTMRMTAQLARLDLETGDLQGARDKLRGVVSTLLPRTQGSGRLGGERYSNDIEASFRRRVGVGLAIVAWRLDEERGTDRKRANDGLLGAQLVVDSTAASAIGQMATRFAAADDALGLLVREGQDLLQRWKALNEQLVAGTADSTVDPAVREEMRAELNGLAKDLEKVDRRLATEFPQYAELARPTAATIGDVQRLLQPDESLVTFLTGKNESFVFAIGQNELGWRRIPVGAEALREKVVRLRKGLDIDELQAGMKSGNVQLFDLKLAYELYEELLGPVDGLIAGRRNLLIVPSGVLTSVPFHLLVTEPPAAPIVDMKQVADYRDAAWIINRHAITVLPSVASLKALRLLAHAPTGEKPLVGFGDPVFGKDKKEGGSGSRRPLAYGAYWKGGKIDYSTLSESLAPLPETADELRAVAKTLGVPPDDIHLGQDATEASVKAANLSPYRIVYFATHGLIAGDVEGLAEPALALSTPANPGKADDGLLTASEVARLKLNADWVVLSACNTAAGNQTGAEAFSGLARSFFYAGARAILVSHWPVDSVAAVQLTTKAFDALRKDPRIGRAEALRQAMLSYMNDPSDPLSAYPAYWAPFAIVGEGGSG